MAAVPIFTAGNVTHVARPLLFLPPSQPRRPTTDSSSRPAILRLRRPPSCSYIVAAAARKHNYAGFLFPRLFLRAAADVGILAAAAATFYDRGLFSVKVCEVIRECGRIRATAAPVSPPALSPSLRTCPATHGDIIASDDMDLV